MKDETDDTLINGLDENHLGHVDIDQRFGFSRWFPIEGRIGWWIGSECESGKGIHDQVDPQQLDSRKNSTVGRRCDGRDESKNDGGDVDRQLELNEFSNGVVDTSTSLDGDDNVGEGVVHENDIGSSLGNFGTTDHQHRSSRLQ